MKFSFSVYIFSINKIKKQIICEKEMGNNWRVACSFIYLL